MKIRSILVAVVPLLIVPMGALPIGVFPIARAHPVSADPDKCVCDIARARNGWCGKCGRGYIAGLPVPSMLLYEEIDPHGHDFDAEKVRCASCRSAIAKESFCETCHIGYVGGLAYMSRLTYRLAQGRPVDTENLSCPTCQDHARDHGWCDKCERGLLGSFSFKNRVTFEAAVKARKIIEAAIRELDRCEVCAAAIVGNGYCPRCDRRYRDGRRVQGRANTPNQDASREPATHPESPDDPTP